MLTRRLNIRLIDEFRRFLLFIRKKERNQEENNFEYSTIFNVSIIDLKSIDRERNIYIKVRKNRFAVLILHFRCENVNYLIAFTFIEIEDRVKVPMKSGDKNKIIFEKTEFLSR